jgi:hypothetical protein
MKVYILFANYGYPFDSIDKIFLNQKDSQNELENIKKRCTDEISENYWIEEHEVIV